MQGRTNHRTKDEVELLEPAITKLVRGLRRDLQKKFGRVDYEQLRKEGYSELLLTCLQDVDKNSPSAKPAARSRRI